MSEPRVDVFSHIVKEHDIDPTVEEQMLLGVSMGKQLRKAERPSLVLIKGLLDSDKDVAPGVAMGVGIGLLGEDRPLYEPHLSIVKDGHAIGVTAAKEALAANDEPTFVPAEQVFNDVTSQLAESFKSDPNGIVKLIGAMAGSREFLFTEEIAA